MINILSAPYFLAAKFEAFHSRGGDYRTSYDFEDIIYVIDNRTTIVNEIRNADEQVKAFLHEELSMVIHAPYYEEIIRTQIHPLMVDDRFPIVLEKIKNVLA
jgi:hypothetical protein